MSNPSRSLFLLLAGIAVAQSGASLQVAGLRCEYLKAPPCIDTEHPRFSWTLSDDRPNQFQSAYRVVVSSSPRAQTGDLWDSGKVSSSETAQIEYKGAALRSRQACYWKVLSWDSAGKPSSWSAIARFSMGLLSPYDWKAQWIGLNESVPSGSWPTPRYLRKQFAVHGAIRHATLYATALGLYRVRLNGQNVGDHILAPEWTSYFNRVQYQAYDVTAMLHDGPNALAACIGNGWYCGGFQHFTSVLLPNNGTEPLFLAQLEIERSDGTRQTVTTDKTWRGTIDGPLRFAGLYEGATFDARKRFDAYDRPGFDDSGWSPAVVHRDVRVGKLVAQRSEPIRITRLLPGRTVKEPQPGVYVVDLGQNIAGWCRLRLQAPKGTEITMKFNEVLNPDGTVYMDNLHAGHLTTGDRQIDRYIARGEGTETFEPDFTYHGFRYVEIHGLAHRPKPSDVTGCVFHTDFTQTGDFTCSNPQINRLVQNIQWSQRANTMGIPTDCCQRDERCGYTGDANFFIGTAVYNFDMAPFLNKWLVDVCEDSQLPGGWFADHAPWFGPGEKPNVGWADAGITIPYAAYRTYGDTRVIREHYPAMRRFMEWQISTAHPDGTRGPDLVGNGDWLNLGGGASNQVIATSYYAYCLSLMAEMARVIGLDEDAARYGGLAARARHAFDSQLVDPEGHIAESSQTGYALAFTMDLVPPARHASMSDCFAQEIARFHDHLATGFIGTRRLLPALHLAGRDDLAYRLLLTDDFPSWLFEVKNGATTVWERWDGYVPGKGFQDSGMNSFNHYAFGSVGEYLYAVIGGITETAPGYAKVRIAPTPEPGLTWAKTHYDSIRGRIVSNWKRENGRLLFHIEVPTNVSAVIHLPGRPDVTVGGGSYDFSVTGKHLNKLAQARRSSPSR